MTPASPWSPRWSATPISDPVGDPAARKVALRREHLAARDAMSVEQRDDASRAVCAHLSEQLSTTTSVAAYMAIRSEVDLRPLLEQLLQRGTDLFLPRVAPQQQLQFARATSLDALQRGAYQIDEPLGDPVDLALLQVVLVPGVAFDRRGARLGFGGGYYDRALAAIRAANRDAIFIGVAFEAQLIAELPTEPRDIAMDRIVTERGGWNTGDIAPR